MIEPSRGRRRRRSLRSWRKPGANRSSIGEFPSHFRASEIQNSDPRSLDISPPSTALAVPATEHIGRFTRSNHSVDGSEHDEAPVDPALAQQPGDLVRITTAVDGTDLHAGWLMVWA